MIKKLVASIFIFFITTNIALAQPDKPIQVFNLKNGQTVVIKEVHTNPIVTIDTWVKTGSINENDNNNGVSHFLEHLFFKGTKNYKLGEVERILESKGATYNAATSKDFTHFYTTIPSQWADLALKMQSDLLLNAIIPEDELNRERKVVQEEIRRTQDNPERIVFNNLIQELFTYHPYRYDTIGTAELIGTIPRESILDYYHKWYVPGNMITVIVGDVDTKKMLSLVKEEYGKQSYCRPPNIRYAVEPFISSSKEKIVKGNYNTGYLEIGFKGIPASKEEESYALDVAASILGNGRTSRLYQSLKEKNNLVSSVSSGHYSLKDDSIFFVDADLKPANYELVKDTIKKEIARLRDEKVTPEELQRAKTQIERQFLYNSESVEEIANSIGNTMITNGKIEAYTDYVDNIKKITADEVQKTANKYLLDHRMAISALIPDKSMVNCANTASTKYKNVTKTSLENGSTLIVDKNESNEIASMSVFVKGGSLIESTPGITSLIASTLMKGTSTKSSQDIANELENSGIVIVPSTNPDYFEIQVKSTLSDFDKALDILADIINNPAFKPEEIEKAKTDIIQDIEEARDNPFPLASEKFIRLIYPNHPYGRVGKVIEANIPKITRDEIINFYQKYFIPANIVISVSGNVDQDKLAQKLNAFFPSREGNQVNVTALEENFKPLDKNLQALTKRESSAGWVLLGWKAPGIMNEKDWASLKVISSILGGGLSSRLFVDLREKQGLAYEVSNIYPTRLDNSFFMLYIGTNPQNIDTVTKGFFSEIEKIKNEPVQEKELEEAKQKIIGRFALAQETNQDKAHYLGWFEVINKGFMYNYKYPEIINSVTSDDIIKAANRYFNYPYAISVVAPAKSIDAVEKESKSESKR